MFVLTATQRGTNTNPPTTISADTRQMGAHRLDGRGPVNTREHILLDGSFRIQLVGRNPNKFRVQGSFAINNELIAANNANFNPIGEWIKLSRMKGLWCDVVYDAQPLGVGLIIDVPTTYDIRVGEKMLRRVWTLDIVMRDGGWEAQILGYMGAAIDNPFVGIDRDGGRVPGTGPTEPTVPELIPPLLLIETAAIRDLDEATTWGSAITMAVKRTTGQPTYNAEASSLILNRGQAQATGLYMAIAIPKTYRGFGRVVAILTSADDTADPLDTIRTSNFTEQVITLSRMSIDYNVYYTPRAVSPIGYNTQYLIVTLNEVITIPDPMDMS